MKRGFSLVELIIALVLLAIIMYGALAIFINSGVKGVNVEVFSVAQTLAEDKLEEVMSRDFGWVSSEAQTSFSGNLSSFSAQLIVSYVASGELNTGVVGPTDYKKVTVQIRHPLLSNPTTLESIRANN